MSALSACMPACQKRALDPSVDGCEPPCGCWELNSGPLEEQSVLLTTGPTLHPWLHSLYTTIHTQHLDCTWATPEPLPSTHSTYAQHLGYTWCAPGPYSSTHSTYAQHLGYTWSAPGPHSSTHSTYAQHLGHIHPPTVLLLNTKDAFTHQHLYSIPGDVYCEHDHEDITHSIILLSITSQMR